MQVKTNFAEFDKILGGGFSSGINCIISGPPTYIGDKLAKFILYKNIAQGIPCGFVSSYQSFDVFLQEMQSRKWFDQQKFEKFVTYCDLFSNKYSDLLIERNIIKGSFDKPQHIADGTRTVISLISRKYPQSFICFINVMSVLPNITMLKLTDIVQQQIESVKKVQSSLVYLLHSDALPENVKSFLFAWCDTIVEINNSEEENLLQITKSPYEADKETHIVTEVDNEFAIEKAAEKTSDLRKKILKFLGGR